MEHHIINLIENVVEQFNNVGPLLGSLLIILESIIPILPLSVFIALNVLAFGLFFGFLISYISTIIGCMLAFILARKFFHKAFYNRMKEDSRAHHFMRRITKLKFSNLVLIIALPFTPAFLVNICAGLSEMSYKKFFFSIAIGKLAPVIFWGFVGDSLIESITNPMVMLKIVLLLLGTYIVSKVIDKNFGIE